MLKRKGFTLVELVIVIAVIAILAGVLIGTFASVINRANESAKLQEIKAQEIQQKADDIIKKIEESDWFGWEDFESSVVAKLTQVYKTTAATNPGITEEQVKQAVKLAMEDYAKAHASDNTSLTEAQVKAIVENALGTLKFEGVTEAQVKAIIDTAQGAIKSSQLTEAQVKAVVEAANAKNLTAAQVAVVLTEKLSGVATTADFETKLNAAVNSLSGQIANVLTSEKLVEILADYVPVTKHVASPEDFIKAYTTLQSGSTIWVDTPDLDLVLTLNGSVDDAKTLTIRGEKIKSLEVTAPKATIFVMNEVGTLDVIAVANNSLHVYGNVTVKLIVNNGRVVVEAGEVKAIEAAPGEKAVVTVEINQGALVETLDAIYQNRTPSVADFINIVNNGTVTTANLSAVPGWKTTTNSTNVRVTNGAGAKGTGTTTEQGKINNTIASTDEETPEPIEITIVDETTDTSTQYHAEVGEDNLTPISSVKSFWGETFATSFAGGDGSSENPYQISNAYELARLSYLMLTTKATEEDPGYQGANYVLTSNIDLTGKTWMPISAYTRNASSTNWFSGVFDGQGYTITGLNDNNLASIYHKNFTGTNKTTVKLDSSEKIAEYGFGLFGSVKKASIKNISLSDVNIVNIAFDYTIGDTSYKFLADGVAALVSYSTGATTIDNITVDGLITGHDCVGGIVGRTRATDSETGDIIIKNCTNNATIKATRQAGGVLAQIGGFGGISSFTISDCVNNGNVTSHYIEDYNTASTKSWYNACGLFCTNSGASIVTINRCYNYGTINVLIDPENSIGPNQISNQNYTINY